MNIKSILVLISFLIWSILCWRWYTCLKGFCDDPAPASIPAASDLPISFLKNSDSAILSAGFERYRDSILLAMQGQPFEIAGHYYADEINSTSFENLGIARAMKTIDLFRSEMNDTAAISANAFLQTSPAPSGAFAATFPQMPTPSSDTISSSEFKIEENNGVSYISFPSGSDKEITDEQLLAYLNGLKSKHPNAKFYVTGHTDNEGNEAKNIKLSLNRAIAVKKLLENTGISATNIISEGKGSASPRVDNTSAENKAKNRRVEIRIEQ